MPEYIQNTQLVRIEHEDTKIGMFVYYDDRDSMYTAGLAGIHIRHERFLTPYMERLDMTSKHFCAYKSIEQMQKWIMPDEFKLLHELGFRVLLLNVSECEVGEYQAIFRREDVISQEDISSLFI